MARGRAARTMHPMHHRLIAVALGIVGVAGLGVARAAQLNVAGGSLGAGKAAVASCQPVGQLISASFTTSWNATAPAGNKATQVLLANVNAACATRNYKIRILDASGNPVAGVSELTGTVPAGGGVVTSAAFTATPVAGIGRVAVVIQS